MGLRITTWNGQLKLMPKCEIMLIICSKWHEVRCDELVFEFVFELQVRREEALAHKL